jgi:murein DD-endopeptidase MepM/ murein hydrolase activator NlpD
MAKHKLAYILLGITVAVFAGLLLFCENNSQNQQTLAQSSTVADTLTPDSSELNMEYGMIADSFSVYKGKIERNQFLADILLKYNVSYPEIDKLVKNAKDIFDVRDIRHGRDYAVYCRKDSTGKAACFVYEPSPTEYVVFDLRDSISVFKGQKEIEVKTKEASGVITSSLFETLVDNDLSPALALELSDIYAWTIDFYRIQKGDYFKVVFDEHYVDDEFIGVGKIHAANFNHMGNPFYAFSFNDGDFEDYYDENGESLRKAFLKSPLKFGRLTSGYTKRRFHPVQKRWKAHLGTDYAAPRGTPIMSTGDGVVIAAQYSKYNGNYVKIRHNATYTTQYLHMTKIKSGIRAGVKVKQSDIIGYVGSTGLATGPHVCYRFWKNGSQVDHRREKLPPSKPVKEDMREEFEQEMHKQKQQLDSIPIDTDAVKGEKLASI